jgi:hypothetical protein
MSRGPSTDNVRTAGRLKGFALLAGGLVALVGLGVARTGESPIGPEAAYAVQPLTGAPQIEGVGARATLAYWGSTDKVDPTRLHLSTVGQGVTIGLANTDKVDEVSFFVDVPKSSKGAFSVDRRAPFTLPRRGRAGLQPYALGAHTLRADALLVNGRHRRLSVAYTVAHIVAMPASVDSAALQQTIEKLPPGPVLIRPPLGETTFTVSGDLTMKRQDVTIDGARLEGGIDFEPGSDGSAFIDGSSAGFGIFGADDVLLRGNVFDGQGIRKDNPIWDRPAGSPPDRFRIIGNTFENFYDDRGEDVHSQAIFVGYSTNGLIDGNTFINNGSTAHIFLSYWGELAESANADAARSMPRDICIRRNTFGPVHGAWYAVNVREEITPASGIRVAPSNVAKDGLGLVSDGRYLGPC